MLINVVGRQIGWGGPRSALPSPCDMRNLPSTGDAVALMGIDPISMPYTTLTKEVFVTLKRPTSHLLPYFVQGRSFGPALTRNSKISVACVCWSSMDTPCSTPGTSPVGAGSDVARCRMGTCAPAASTPVASVVAPLHVLSLVCVMMVGAGGVLLLLWLTFVLAPRSSSGCGQYRSNSVGIFLAKT